MTSRAAAFAGLSSAAASLASRATSLQRLRESQPARSALLLEDDEPLVVLLARVLRDEFPGLQVDTFGTLTDARAWLADHAAPRLAILDGMLPDGHGWDLAAELPRVGVWILMTSGAMPEDELGQASELVNARAWMAKPVDLERLLAFARRALV